MMSLPDPSLEEEAIPEFLRPVVAAIKSLLLLHPYSNFVSGFADRRWCAAGWACYANSDAVTDELVDILVGPAQDRGLLKLFLPFLKA